MSKTNAVVGYRYRPDEGSMTIFPEDMSEADIQSFIKTVVPEAKKYICIPVGGAEEWLPDVVSYSYSGLADWARDVLAKVTEEAEGEPE